MRKDLLEKNNDWSDLNLPVQSRNNMPKSPAKSTDSSKWKKLWISKSKVKTIVTCFFLIYSTTLFFQSLQDLVCLQQCLICPLWFFHVLKTKNSSKESHFKSFEDIQNNVMILEEFSEKIISIILRDGREVDDWYLELTVVSNLSFQIDLQALMKPVHSWYSLYYCSSIC